ncbi:RCC1 domain-containing protein [Nakamurella antarctica]|uniref:RCC1 domain-containing protein n=1 Tax=Nakamurella antarctica TaxID=1902245 RepID=UPI0013DE6C0F|nr:hypothetical protein [Nakamurella antarctica]
MNKSLMRGAVAVTAALGLVFAPATAFADPAPVAGPAAGGTAVSGIVPVSTLSFTQVSAGTYFSAALDSAGNAYTWGWNDDGQLGNNTLGDSLIPAKVPAPVGVKFTQISSGARHVVALGNNGKTYAWGYGDFGQLGNGLTASSSVPVEVTLPAGATFTSIDSGNYYTVARGSNGKTYAWGDNFLGQLGQGDSGSGTNRAVPVEVPLPVGVTLTSFSAGANFVLALGSDTQMYAWGHNVNGQLGDGNPVTSVKNPTVVPFPVGVVFTQVSAGDSHSGAVDAAGNAYTWGNNQYGEIGNGNVGTDYSTPQSVTLPAGVTFSQITTGPYVSEALGSDGKNYAWGSGNYQQLGDGTSDDRPLPTVVQTPTGVTFTQVAIGDQHTVALGSDLKIYTYGEDSNGALGNGPELASIVPDVISDVVATSVLYGANAATALANSDDATWTAVTPAGCGPVDVTVQYRLMDQTLPAEVFPAAFTFGTAAAVTTQPIAGALPAGGGNFAASVAFSGDDAPAVQWQSSVTGADPWTNIAGATSANSALPITNTTFIRAAGTNCYGQVLSASAQVTVAAAVVNPVVPPKPADPVVPPKPADPVVPPKPADPVKPASPPNAGNLLANTGAPVLPLMLSAFALLLIGGATTFLSRPANRSRNSI